jgi:DNA-binding LacI/PurR family transcriptional regulator
MKRATTIRDVAARAGVSVGTVSAVINRSPSVAESTRQRVLNRIQELSYKPNSKARSLRRHGVSAVGLIVPDLKNPFFSSVAEGVQITAEENDVLLVLCMTGARAEREQYYAQTLMTARLDGVIYLSGSGIPSPHLLLLAKSRQILFVDESLPGVDIPFITSENRSGARAVAKHVLSMGHREVAIIGGPARLWTSEQRLAGYREALVGAGLNPDDTPMVAGEYDEASGYRIAQELLRKSKPAITALLCANDLMAIGAMKLCRDIGLRVPLDISITGFDNIPASSLLDPALTTVAQPGLDMGRAAAQLLLHQIKGISPPLLTIFPTELCVRGSVVAPNTNSKRSPIELPTD